MNKVVRRRFSAQYLYRVTLVRPYTRPYQKTDNLLTGVRAQKITHPLVLYVVSFSRSLLVLYITHSSAIMLSTLETALLINSLSGMGIDELKNIIMAVAAKHKDDVGMAALAEKAKKEDRVGSYIAANVPPLLNVDTNEGIRSSVELGQDLELDEYNHEQSRKRKREFDNKMPING